MMRNYRLKSLIIVECGKTSNSLYAVSLTVLEVKHRLIAEDRFILFYRSKNVVNGVIDWENVTCHYSLRTMLTQRVIFSIWIPAKK